MIESPTAVVETPKAAARRLAKPALRDGFKPEALHAYTDAADQIIFWRIRLKHPTSGEKWVRPMRRTEDGYALGEPPMERKPIYALHTLTVRPDEPVIVTEGEFKADQLHALGLLATTSGGADSSAKSDWSALAGRDVLIWPDNDTAGQRYAADVAAILRDLGCAVRVLNVAVLGLPPKGDAVEWLADHPNATAADVLTLPCVADAPQPETAMPKPLPDELLPVEAFPLAALPEAFRPWVTDVSQRMNCPPDFVAVPLIVAAASLVARHVRIRPQARTDWTEPGNLWALIVGRPGIMKSPAMAQALAPMERLEARAADEYRRAISDFTEAKPLRDLRAEASKKAARAALKKNAQADVSDLLKREADDDEPIRRRYVVADATYEKLGEIFACNPGGVLSVRDEMRGLFLHLAREESATARAFYLQAWSGGSYHFDRIGRGTVTVEDARLSMIGGIQPGPLADLTLQARRGAADDGMIERFLIAWPDSPSTWKDVDRLPDNDAKRKAWEAFERLDGITPDALRAEVQTDFAGEPQGLPFLRFTDDAREAFAEWRADLEAKLRGADLGSLESALSKFRHHVPALALALHVVDGGTGPVALTPTTRALALADYFESHARRLHASGRRVAVRGAHAILDKARAGDLPDPFTARDVYRNQWAGLADRVVVADALDLLVAHGWLAETTIAAGADGGRPTTIYTPTEGARHG